MYTQWTYVMHTELLLYVGNIYMYIGSFLDFVLET